MAENNILQGIEVNGAQYSFPQVTKDTAIGSTPSTTNVPTSKAVSDYVDEKFKKSDSKDDIEEMLLAEDDYDPKNPDNSKVIAKIGRDGFIAKNHPYKLNFDNTLQSSVPLSVVRDEAGLASIFRNWGFIGDSLCSGEMECFDNDGNKKYIDMYDFSWGQFLCRRCGSIGYNYSNGGLSIDGQYKWWNHNRGWAKLQEDMTSSDSTKKRDAFVIAIGVNDIAWINKGNESLGTIADINIEDYNNNADSFCGSYGMLIQKIKELNNKCYIFVTTLPNYSGFVSGDTTQMNERIRQIADMFDRVYCIDLAAYIGSKYSSSNFSAIYRLNGHMTPSGYYFTSLLMMNYIDWLIRNNPTDFKEVALVNTDYSGTIIN